MLLPHRFKVALILLLLMAGCATISQFDHHAYVHTIDAKVEALGVMGLATDSYSQHRDEVAQVQKALDKIYEYERNRVNNGTTLQLWDKLRDTSGNLWGGFVKRWKAEDRVGAFFIEQKKEQVSAAFDIIAQLESKKIKPKNIK